MLVRTYDMYSRFRSLLFAASKNVTVVEMYSHSRSLLFAASKNVTVAETVRFTRMNSGWSGAADSRPDEMTEEVDSTLVVRVEEADGEEWRAGGNRRRYTSPNLENDGYLPPQFMWCKIARRKVLDR